MSFLAASSVPTPLYSRYAAKWRFSPITTTVVFGAYAIAVLIAAGILVVHGGGLVSSARDYALFLIALAATALAGLLRAEGHGPA